MATDASEIDVANNGDVKSDVVKQDGLGSVVAKHYDNLPEKGKEQRKDSRIYHMRNFNNWIKSALIQEYVDKIKKDKGDYYKANVLDIGNQNNNVASKFFQNINL